MTHVPEVAELEEVEDKIQRLIDDNTELFDKLRFWVSHRNALVDAADKKIRALGASVGDWKKLRDSYEVDAQKLLEEVGESDFKALGGKIESKTVYVVDMDVFNGFLARNEIPKDLQDIVMVRRVAYKHPKKYELP